MATLHSELFREAGVLVELGCMDNWRSYVMVQSYVVPITCKVLTCYEPFEHCASCLSPIHKGVCEKMMELFSIEDVAEVLTKGSP